MGKNLIKVISTAMLLVEALCLNAQRIAPAAYNGDSKIGFIRTWDATSPQSNPDTLLSKSFLDVRQISQYFDGLGKPIQTVIKKGSLVTGGMAYDMVSANVYDPTGREVYQYLPFAANSTGGNNSLNNGAFKLNPFQQDSVFSKTMFDDENWIYGQISYEASPLNRVIETFAAGNSWVGTSAQSNEADRHSAKTKYWVNTKTDSVRIWTVTDVANSLGTYTTTAMYDSGTLHKTVTANENNNQIIEFKDTEGKLILKKVQLSSQPDTGKGRGYSGWLCTYFIYDNLNKLRCVVQPKGVELLVVNSWDMSYSSGVILNEQCFRYEFDYRKRLTMKKIPGAGVTVMVYDSRDRLVMTQDSLMRSGHQWMYTQYDNLNRPTATGIFVDNSNYNNLSYHSVRADSSAVYPAPGTYTIDTLTKTFYDDYAWRSGQGSPLSSNRNNTYDSYFLAASNSTWPYVQDATAQTSQLIGTVTGRKTKVLGTASTYLYTVNFYDEKLRPVQVQSQNITTGIDITSTQYNWSGQVVLSIVENEKATGNAQTNVVLTQISYDSLMRVIKIEKKASNTKVNDGSMPASWKTIVQNEYNALGQLRKRKLGAAPLDSLTYEYNIRGWMLGMNRAYVKDTTSTSNWFGFDLGYDKTGFMVNGNNKNYVASQYNGNIGGMIWKSTGDDQLRKYDFTYDAINRLTGADFNQLTNNNFSKDAKIDFGVSGLSYDANGNILAMNQRGWIVGGSVTIDSLLYTYNGNSNKLLNVLDRKNDTATRLGDFRSSKTYMTALSNNKTTGATDYIYDGNGNMYVDNNKDISNIHYNHLNLPDSITVAGKGNIKYVYDAMGVKLKKITTEGAKITTTLYLLGNYVNDTLQFLTQEEGRIRFNVADNSLQYDYFIKDHLGNVRMVLTEQTQTDAYPVASLESSTLSTEKLFYAGLDTGRVNKNTVTGYPNDTYTSPNDYIQKLNGNGAKVGASIVLKVMAGDKFNLLAKSWWKSTNTPGTPLSPLNDLLAALAGGIGGLGGNHATASEIASSGVLSPNVTGFLNNHNTYNVVKPKAFINWVLLDERFNYVSSGSGFEQVGGSDTLTTHTKTNLTLDKSGYLYIYVSNETPNIDVFFDNLQVTHIRGPLLEETHYYPFGLTMAGISSKALAFGGPVNRRNKFQNQEYNDDLGVDMYEFKYRMDDPQTGRFWQIDPLSDKYVYNSTYAFSENKVTNHVELEGLEAVSAGSPQGYLLEGFRQWFQSIGNAFSGSAEVHVNHGVETKTEIKTPVVTVSNTTTAIISETKFEIKTNFGDFLGGRSKSPTMGVSLKNNSFPRVETKTSATINTEGAPIKMSTKTTVDENGKSQTTSVGTGASINTEKGGVDVSASFFYKEQLSGNNAGQSTYGFRAAADATFVSHRYVTIDSKNIKITTTTQTTVGGSVELRINH